MNGPAGLFTDGTAAWECARLIHGRCGSVLPFLSWILPFLERVSLGGRYESESASPSLKAKESARVKRKFSEGARCRNYGAGSRRTVGDGTVCAAEFNQQGELQGWQRRGTTNLNDVIRSAHRYKISMEFALEMEEQPVARFYSRSNLPVRRAVTILKKIIFHSLCWQYVPRQC